MTRLLVTVSFLVATAALAKSVLDFRGSGRLPLVDLFRDRFQRPPSLRRELGLGAALGVGVVAVPLLLFAAAGWTVTSHGLELPGRALGALLASAGLKIVWAALEELIFRGAVLPQLCRLGSARAGLGASALVFA